MTQLYMVIVYDTTYTMLHKNVDLTIFKILLFPAFLTPNEINAKNSGHQSIIWNEIGEEGTSYRNILAL